MSSSPDSQERLLYLLGEVPEALLLHHRLADQATSTFERRGTPLLLVIGELVQPHQYTAPLAAGLSEVFQRLPVPTDSIACAALALLLPGPGVMAQGAGFPGERKEGGTGRSQGKRTCGGLAAELGPGSSEFVQGHPGGG